MLISAKNNDKIFQKLGKIKLYQTGIRRPVILSFFEELLSKEKKP